MNIGLINPNREIKEPAIHLGLGYLASYAMQQDKSLNFKLLDTRVASEREYRKFHSASFDLIGITASSQVYSEALEIARMIKKEAPGTPIVIGGPHASTVKEEVLETSLFDFAVFGEGEITFYELINYLRGQIPIETINGLIYKTSDGRIIKNPARAIIPDVDSIPFPLYRLFPMERYPQHRMITSRGCPYNCVFCNSRSIWTNRWRKRSAESVFREAEHLISGYSLKSFVFNDDSFNIDAARVEKICDLFTSNNTGIIWTTSIRADRVTQAMALKMKKAGCYNVNIGIESANNRILEMMQKKITKEKIYDGIQILRQSGLDVMGQFMIGNPGDTMETVKESIEFAKTSNLTGVEFYTALPYKDSFLYEYVKESGKILTERPVYEYHRINPRIIFETPEFTYQERLQAIELARQNGFYHALSTDNRSILLDIGKSATKKVQILLGSALGNRVYLIFRNIYQKVFVRKR